MTTKTTQQIFSANLRELLDKQHKTQHALAKYLNTTDATVSRWVNGEQMPRAKMIDKMATFFMCAPDELTASKERTVQLLPQDIIADAIHDNAKLFQLFLVATHASDEQIDACIALLKK